MLKLKRILKNYQETGSLAEQVNLYGFIGPEVFLTKSGETGVVLEVKGVDYECLDQTAIDGFTKRLESALKLFDESCRVYQFLFKRNNQGIPYQLYVNPVVDAAIANRIAYLRSKASTLYSLSVYYVVLYRRSETSERLATALSRFLEHPAKSFFELCAQSFSTKSMVLVLGKDLDEAQAAVLQKARNFILQVSDFLPAKILGKQEAFAVLKRTLNFDPQKLGAARLKHDTFLDYYLPESHVECHRRHLRVDEDYVKVLTLKEPSAQSFPLIFRRLLEVEANYHIVTEWKKEDSGKTRRTIQAKRRHFHNTKRSFASQVSLNDAPAQDALLDDSKEAQVRELGEGLQEIEIAGNYFGLFSLTVVIYDRDLAKVDRACAEFYKVFSVHDAQLYEEKYNLLNAFLAAVPGNHVFNLRYLLSCQYQLRGFLVSLYARLGRCPQSPSARASIWRSLKPTTRPPIFLNLHYRDVAHTMILGRTGAGKSFLLNFLITSLQKYSPHTFIFDLGGSFESLTQLFGGSYVRVGLESQDFKINPFSLPPSKENLDFLALFREGSRPGAEGCGARPGDRTRSLSPDRESLLGRSRVAHARCPCQYARPPRFGPTCEMDPGRAVRILVRQRRRHHFVFALPVLSTSSV